MALSHVRRLDDMTLWDFCPSAIRLLQFYQDLLKWCDCVDAIRPTPSTDVPFPNRSDISNAPFTNSTDSFDTSMPDDMQSRTISFPKYQKQQPKKRKRQDNSQAPHMKRQKLQTTTATLNANVLAQTSLHITVPNRHLQCLSQFQHTVAHVLREPPQQILSHLVPFATSSDLAVHFSTLRSSLEFVVSELNSLLFPHANMFPSILQDTCASNRCHPLLLQILKPVWTTGDGNCMYNALSLTLTGTEQFSHLIRLLCAYALNTRTQ